MVYGQRFALTHESALPLAQHHALQCRGASDKGGRKSHVNEIGRLMSNTFNCPACGAPLEYEDAGDRATVRCPFCNNSVIVPEAMRRRAPGQDYRDGSAGRSASSKSLLALFVVIVVVVAMFGIVFTLTKILSSSPTNIAQHPAPPPPPFPTIPKGKDDVPTPGYATLALKFGSEGTGPGFFNDSRSIALDGEGRIYVGDYTGGRVQVFDATGKFITQWMCDPKMPLRALAADRRGNVYVVQSGLIQRYEGATGKQLGKLQYAGGWGFDDVTPTADGGLVTAWYKASDDIVRFNSDGAVTKVMRAAISGQTDSSELDMRVAVDGLGNIYALGTFNKAVLKFTPEGKYVNKFGGSGDQPGQFHAPQAIAVDKQGRIYVSDINGIQVFDSGGRHITTFKADGFAFGMIFNDRNELFIAARTQVLKYTLNKP